MKKFYMIKRLLIPILAIILIVGAGIWYVNDYYHSDESVQLYLQGNENVIVTEIEEGLYLDGKGTEAALIFYPGAKVEYTAYAPLFFQIAEHGVDCFLVEMPCNLAILGQDKADSIREMYDYEQWYLSGHSLGGAMAAAYASKHLEGLDGLVLLASYPTKSLDNESFTVLSIYGSEDGVLNWEKLESGNSFMPADYTEVCIEGGNHALFGNYGEQEGDGVADISREEQQKQTMEVILEIITKQK